MLRNASLPVLLLAVGLTACSGCSTTAPPAAPAPATAETPDAAAPDTTAPDTDAPELPAEGDYRPVEVATVGWDRLGSAPVVLLREPETGQLVPIWVGVAEARAIAAALHEVEYPRPMTHDLMADLLVRLDAHLDELLIHDLVNGTYLGMLRLSKERNGGAPLLVDTRPSDGMALALRAGATIRVAQKILDDTPDVDFMAPDEPDQVVRALGLTVVTPTPEQRAEHRLPEERAGLLVIRAIGNAAVAGISRGDLLVEVAGAAVEEPVDLLDAVRDLPYGDPVPMVLWRDGEERRVTVVPEREGRTGPKPVV